MNGEPVPYGNIVSVAADEEGHIYVLDTMNRTVFVHTLEGESVGSFGREGEGPGEFDYPTEVAFVRPDTIKVFDDGLWRVTTFSPEGRLLMVETVDAQQLFGQVFENDFGPRGTLYNLGYGRYQQSLGEALGYQRSGAVRGVNTLQLWNTDRHAWSDIADVPGLEVFVDRETSTTGSIQDVPFARRGLWAATDNAVWYADSDTHELVRYSRSGDEICRIRLNLENPRVSERERRTFYEAEDLADDPRFRERLSAIRARRAAVPINETKPALTRLVVSSGGDLWLEVQTRQTNEPAPGASPSGTVWHVLSPIGIPIGVGTISGDFELMVAAGRDYVVGVRRGEVGTDQVSIETLQWLERPRGDSPG